jgi:hypothetical protein
MAGSDLTYKYLIRVGVNGRCKHSTLLQYYNNYGNKKFFDTGPKLKNGVILDFSK